MKYCVLTLIAPHSVGINPKAFSIISFFSMLFYLREVYTYIINELLNSTVLSKPSLKDWYSTMMNKLRSYLEITIFKLMVKFYFLSKNNFIWDRFFDHLHVGLHFNLCILRKLNSDRGLFDELEPHRTHLG